VNNLLTINSNGKAIKSCELISVSGQLVKRINVTSGTTYISVSKENPGIYILKLYGNHDEVLEVKKITVVH
ncbi:MAG: T9SS type A sorting domain-containing protein, partial [Bacteroidetes bacterium]